MAAATADGMPAAGSGIALWLADLDRDGGRMRAHADRHDLLDATDQRRRDSFRDAADAAAFVAARAALDLVLVGYGAAPGTRLRRTRGGKPHVEGLPAFSLSHTAGFAAIAVTPSGAVGIDIERTREAAPGHPLIGRIAGLVPGGLLAAWTIAEAWAKFHGIAMADLLDSAGRARDLEAAIADPANPPFLAGPSLPRNLVGSCWHDLAGATVTVHRLDLSGPA